MKRIAFVIILIGLVYQVNAQNYQLHAVYMYQFTKYIQWPSDKNQGDFEIGVLGDSEIIEHLEKMATIKKVAGRNIVIKKFTNLDAVTTTHMLYVDGGVNASIEEVLKKVGSTNTLVITEKVGDGLRGSNINFIQSDGRLKFELNQSAMDQQELKVAKELLKLGLVI